MNKQEAIDELKKYKVGFGEAAAVRFDRIVSVINQIHEPQKVVVPKYIADKIEYCKDAEGYGLFHTMDYCYQYKDSAEWLECNQETFARAWLFGYEIEQEKLYTVEIPNPHVNAYTVLQKQRDNIVLVGTPKNSGWRDWGMSQLTEAEIKQDFEWAWQFAKEVE
ncbi:DUF1642 domain-containing protein [Streptococcus suis]|nr:DUF1642 domain-containing protein [Streptococcus suis]